MPELIHDSPPPRPELLRSVAARLHQLVPGFRPIAGDLLADGSRIDWFGADAEGRGVLALVGERDEDALLLIARGLAQCAWVREHLADWLKLAPTLPLAPDAEIHAWVLCPGFASEARTAAAALEAGAVRLGVWRRVRNGSGADLLLEPVELPARPRRPRAPEPGDRAGFRTGLSDRDLGLTDAERAEFD